MKASLKEAVNKILQQFALIGATYTASWTASSASAFARLTNTMTLPAGTYVITLRTAVASNSSLLPYSLYGVADTYCQLNGSSATSIVVTFSSTTTTYMVCSYSASNTFSYTERGGLTAVRIA